MRSTALYECDNGIVLVISNGAMAVEGSFAVII
jgi:hypothetical protein